MGGQRRHAPRTPPSIRTRGRHHLAATQGTPAPQLRAVQPEGGTPASDRQHARGSSGSVGQALHDLGVTDPARLVTSGHGFFWPMFPIAFWSIGMIMNAWDVYGH